MRIRFPSPAPISTMKTKPHESVQVGKRSTYSVLDVLLASLVQLAFLKPQTAGAQTIDTNFNPGANSSVISLALQADGENLAGGYFTTLGG